MNNLIDNNLNMTYYAVKVNGQIVSAKYMSPQQAEMQIQHLNEAHQTIAEVVAVTSDGKELLLG